MNGPADFVEEVDCGSFFDQIDDLLDFPTDDIEACLPAAAASSSAGNANSFPSLWSTHSDSVFSHENSASDLSAELSVPYEDIVQLEWLSNFVEDSFSGETLTMNKDESTCTNKDSSNQFQTPSPISVLETTSSSSGDHKPAPWSPETVAPGKRVGARSKRPRPSSFVPRLAMQLISPDVAPKASSDSENCAESRLLIKLPKPVAPEHKKKKMKFTIPVAKAETQEAQNVRKCMHCEITKTPQWRAGPMGPKTLCNACGVRYKSGRLFPEYRPAASPTFVPSLHSNSHKKVVEMRNRVCEKTTSAGSMKADSPELIPNDSTPYV